MAAISFPADPTAYTSSPWTAPNGSMWRFSVDRNRWTAVSPAADTPLMYFASATPPPSTNLPWYDTSDGTWSVWNAARSVWVVTGVGGTQAIVGPPGPVASVMRRADTVGDVNYCGTAPAGSLETDYVWSIIKLSVTADGTLTQTSATAAQWSARTSTIYS